MTVSGQGRPPSLVIIRPISSIGVLRRSWWPDLETAGARIFFLGRGGSGAPSPRVMHRAGMSNTDIVINTDMFGLSYYNIELSQTVVVPFSRQFLYLYFYF